MKIANIIKNLMLASSMTTLYAIWSKEGLHEVTGLHAGLILVLVGILIFHLLCVIDREITRIQKERKKKSKCKRTHSVKNK